MNFIGIDLHTNRFTCCYRTERSQANKPKDHRMETFNLTDQGLKEFYTTLTPDTMVLLEATTTSFSFTRRILDRVQDVIIANTYELKQISLARCNTDKIDADKLCRILKMQVLSGEQTISPVTLPPVIIQELRGLFSTYRLLQKQKTQVKNRIHSLLKEALLGATQEEIFSQRRREEIRNIGKGSVLHFQINLLLDQIEQTETALEALKHKIQLHAEPYLREIEILTSMKGVSVFIAIAIIADIIEVSRFRNSKAFTSYLRSAPRVSNSNTTTSIRGTNKRGRKLSATLLTQSLNHVLAASLKLRKWYERLSEYKKAGLVRTGLRRRVLTELYQMLKKGEYHYNRDEQKHQAKMNQYRRFLEKHRTVEISQNTA